MFSFKFLDNLKQNAGSRFQIRDFRFQISDGSLHINNIFKEGELQEDSVVKEYLTTAADGKKTVCFLQVTATNSSFFRTIKVANSRFQIAVYSVAVYSLQIFDNQNVIVDYISIT